MTRDIESIIDIERLTDVCVCSQRKHEYLFGHESWMDFDVTLPSITILTP
jgi:hypothetical protein